MPERQESLLAQADRDFAEASGFVSELVDKATTLLEAGTDPTRVWAGIADRLREQAEKLEPERATYVALTALAASCVRAGRRRDEPEPDDPVDHLLATLAVQAQEDQPRLFAICGMYQDPPVMADEDPTYVEWGLEFPDRSVAIAWSSGSLTTSTSARQILDGNAKLGPARLVWFR